MQVGSSVAETTESSPWGGGEGKLSHEGDLARSSDRRKRSNPRGGWLPVFSAGNRPHGFAASSTEDAERPRVPARRPILRARRLVVRGAACVDEASRPLDRLLERRRDQVSQTVGANLSSLR